MGGVCIRAGGVPEAFRIRGLELFELRPRGRNLLELPELTQGGSEGAQRERHGTAGQALLGVAKRLAVAAQVVLRQRQLGEDAPGLRIVGAEAQAAQQRIHRFGEVPEMHADPAEPEIAEGEVGAEVDGVLRLGERLLVPPAQHVDEG